MYTKKRYSYFATNIFGIAFLILVVSTIGFRGTQTPFDPVAIFLTWQTDPTTSMTIDWHTTPQDGDRGRVLQYKKIGDANWLEIQEKAVDRIAFPYSDRTINRVEIRGLDPGTKYRFRFGDNSRAYYFKTMPASLENETIRFAKGGDTRHREDWMSETNRAVMEYEPDFILWAGDLAYANGEPYRVDRWYSWFNSIKETLITENGRVIPIINTIGNHELYGVRRLYRAGHPHQAETEEEARKYLRENNLWEDKATYFFHLFAFPGNPPYGVLDFADYMSIIALDSNHFTTVRGAQAAWLEEILAERSGRKHLFPAYHRPAYPSVRNIMGGHSIDIREAWVPFFEKHGVRIAFEAHDHAYKRTPPMSGLNVVDENEGIVYVGDGAWGVNTRSMVHLVPPERIHQYDFDLDSGDVIYVHEFGGYIVRDRSLPEDYLYESSVEDIPYLEAFAAKRHGVIVDVHSNGGELTTVTSDGKVIDNYSWSLN